MTSGCLDRKEVRGAIWGVHSTTDRPASGNTGRLFLAFGRPVCADRISNCPLDRVLTYKNLIYLLNLQFFSTEFFLIYNTNCTYHHYVLSKVMVHFCCFHYLFLQSDTIYCTFLLFYFENYLRLEENKSICIWKIEKYLHLNTSESIWPQVWSLCPCSLELFPLPNKK